MKSQNDAVNRAVDRAVSWDVNSAVNRAVYWEVWQAWPAVWWPVSRAVWWPVSRAVYGAVDRAVRQEPEHPALQDYLRSAELA